jgi:hypothetical protein
VIAGTLARLDTPADEPLEATATGGTKPALSVAETQQDLDGNVVVQHGEEAGTAPASGLDISVIADDGDVTIVTERFEASEPHVTDWVADVTGTGLIAVESLGGDGNLAFPLDFIASQTDRFPHRLGVNIERLATNWGLDDDETWYVSRDDGKSTELVYHDDADRPDGANIGLGFRRPYKNTIAHGVVYDSGYLAVYSNWTHAVFMQFVADEVRPFCAELGGQVTLGESA